jgi:hypothetical protein
MALEKLEDWSRYLVLVLALGHFGRRMGEVPRDCRFSPLREIPRDWVVSVGGIEVVL